MPARDKDAFRPFHETIVDAIYLCPSPSSREIFRLFELIKETKIPRGHDEIIAAIDYRFDFSGATKFAREVREVKNSLLVQKQANTSVTEGEEGGVNLDNLQKETEKLLALLTDREPGLVAWHEGVNERLESIYDLISRALGK